MGLPTDIHNPGAPSRQVDPASLGAAITPTDDTDLPVTCRGIYVGVGGDVAVILDGMITAMTFKNAAQGRVLPIRVRRVMATGTAATNLIALW